MQIRGSRQEAAVRTRLRVVELAEAKGVSAAARELRHSRTTVYRLLERYAALGLAGLLNAPRGPRGPVVPELEELIVAAKVQGPHRSTGKVQQVVEAASGFRVSRQTVWRVLSARGLMRLQEPVALQRFARPEPNQLWQLDLKEDVRFPWGKAHLVTLVDDATRFCLGGAWVLRKTEPVVLGALAGVFRRWGLPEAILSDRAVIFHGPATHRQGVTTYQLALETLGVRAAFARPYHPQTKGKVEKFLQLVKHDFLPEVGLQTRSLAELNAAWATWVTWYNTERPHGSLGDGTPARRYRASARAAPPEAEQLLQVVQPRRVARDATVALRGQRLPLAPAWIGRHVWVGELGDTVTVSHSGQTIARFQRGVRCPD